MVVSLRIWTENIRRYICIQEDTSTMDPRQKAALEAAPGFWTIGCWWRRNTCMNIQVRASFSLCFVRGKKAIYAINVSKKIAPPGELAFQKKLAVRRTYYSWKIYWDYRVSVSWDHFFFLLFFIDRFCYCVCAIRIGSLWSCRLCVTRYKPHLTDIPTTCIYVYPAWNSTAIWFHSCVSIQWFKLLLRHIQLV